LLPKVAKKELYLLKNIVKNTDDEAFMIVMEASEMLGLSRKIDVIYPI